MSRAAFAEADLPSPTGAAQEGFGRLRGRSIPAYLRVVLWGGLFAFALVVFAQLGPSWGVHNDFTQNAWLPARLVLDGVNPYHASTAQVNAALGQYSGDFAGFNSGADYVFIYPVWVALAMIPFGAMPLAAATVLWRALNLLLIVWAAGALIRRSNPAFTARSALAVVALAVPVFLSVIFRPTFLNLYIGQFAIIEFGLLVAVWCWLISSGGAVANSRPAGDLLAGLALAILATKPQATGLAVLLLAVWALSRRRYVLPAGAVVSLAALLLIPVLFYPSSLSDWLHVVFGEGQASSQAQASASVWGLSYSLLGKTEFWVPVALVASLVGIGTLLPRWRRDLIDRTSPVPLSLPVTLCMGAIISPYLLGYEHTLLLLPALVLYAAAGLPDADSGAAERDRNDRRGLRLAVLAWLALLPYLVVALQSAVYLQGQVVREYPVIAQSVAMLGMCWVVKLKWQPRHA